MASRTVADHAISLQAPKPEQYSSIPNSIIQPTREDASRTLFPAPLSNGSNGDGNSYNDLKRRKLSPDVYEASSSMPIVPAPPHPSYPTPLTTPSPVLPAPIPTSALLYHFALSAHRSSHLHLQQAFIPTSISADPNAGSPLLPFHQSVGGGVGQKLFFHDREAANKALGLQLLALDLLKAGLADSGLSDRERVAYGLEFGVVGLKVYSGYQALSGHQHGKGKGKATEPRLIVDLGRLMDDLQDTVAQSYFVAQRQSSLSYMRLQLEILNARLAFLRGKFNLGKRMVQQALSLNRDNPSHRYALYLLYLEFIEIAAPAEFLSVIDELLIVQLASFIKTRSLFVHRRWELVPSALSDLAASIAWTNDRPNEELLAGTTDERTWRCSIIVHHLLLRTLWEGRIGNDEAAKMTMKRIYVIMDLTADRGVFDALRASGGLLKPLVIQITPPNITFILTYLTTVVSRRDFTGTTKACRNLMHSKVMREKENFARADDMWDTGFSPSHGLAQAIALQQQVMSIRGEVMLEQVLALMARSAFQEAHKLLLEAIDHFQSHDLFHPLSPHLCLLFAQHAHYLGIDTLAVRYYRACKALINEGSELSLIAEIGQLGAENQLFKLLDDPKRQDVVNALADKCKMSTSAMFTAAGHFLASLTDSNRVHSKKQLSTAYEISGKANNNVLRLLIFAFTTSTHHYGNRERMFRQLETGRDIARLLGGKDRPDGVGQTILGLWFAYRLKEFNRQEGYQDGVTVARESIAAHLNRLTETKKMAQVVAMRVSNVK
ncbi:hypothetical protein CI109_101234 [Kwoniella shandongensis]|uniref:Uncharacterized protein n=1 Tax=Kwoniella shandongensis TaxID=1734106 RepID=A0AAJ8LFB8_9TREE